MSNVVIEWLKSQFDERVLTDQDSLEHYGKDWTKKYTPAPAAIVFPKSTEEVQKLVQYANKHRLALVPSGGRTGLSGGAVAANGEIVVAFDKMNAILDFDAGDRLVQCQAGVITEQLQRFADDNDLYYPVDFASSGSSQIGGNLSTNAGGIKVIRWGMSRDWVAGLTVVTGKGDILELNRGLVKNNTGYDLGQLFIAGEGTLGFITEATMRLTRKPQNLQVMVLGLSDFDHVMDVLKAFSKHIEITAFEFFSHKAMGHVLDHGGVAAPFTEAAPYYALLEYEVISEAVEMEAMNQFEQAVEAGWVLDGVVSQSEAQAASLWRLREGISESIAPHTPYKNDIAVRPSRVPEFLKRIDEVVSVEYPDFEIIWFGHIGDGNLHLNILKPVDLDKATFFSQCERVNTMVFDIVRDCGGTISAEHGVGLLKQPYLAYSRSAEEIAYMRAIKAVFDPNHVMNPGKLLAPESAS